MNATLFGIGVGPGDPELLTLKALRIIQAAPVIAYIAAEGGESLARSIVEKHIKDDKVEITLPVPMRADPAHGQKVYDRFAPKIADHLKAGRSVAVLCEGDPLFYGSFMYLLERLANDHSIKVIPGVTSISAVAAVAALPLVSRNDSLVVAPATLPEGELEARMRGADAIAIMKVGRHLEKVRRVLKRLAITNTRYVERATMDGQRILPLEHAPDKAPYFSMILAHKGTPQLPDAPKGAAIISLSPAGLDLAERLQKVLPESKIHDLSDAQVSEKLRSLFEKGTPIVGICATGILVRILAPLIADKHAEPPVVAVAVDGSFAVPILGGHNGANRLAQAIAAATKGRAALTTAGDVAFGLALDDPPKGWHVANPAAAKGIVSALLAGEPVGLKGTAPWLTNSAAPFVKDGPLKIIATDLKVDAPGNDLVLHPQTIAVGVGCERGCDPAELIQLAEKTLDQAGLSPLSVACIVSLDLKSDEEAMHALARHLNVPARFFNAQELEALTPRLANPSDIVFKAVGCHGVAEGAALAAAGNDAQLIVEKTGSKRATCAVARSMDIIKGAKVGIAQGQLVVIGIGPGAEEWRTPAATKALQAADHIVGYGLYLELLGDLVKGKICHESKMTQEEKRARKALDLAAEGKSVALVSSGDAGIYGLATLVFELLDREERPDWSRLDVSVIPGVSALQAAASRIGAPINHDFCTISLSDLLTPMDQIERRLQAAADGDFVIALYNPVSKKRRTQLELARKILLTARSKSTPVVLARNLGRDEETLNVITLGELTPDHADMLTIVLIGNKQTRTMTHGGKPCAYTPRGYSKKMDRK